MDTTMGSDTWPEPHTPSDQCSNRPGAREDSILPLCDLPYQAAPLHEALFGVLCWKPGIHPSPSWMLTAAAGVLWSHASNTLEACQLAARPCCHVLGRGATRRPRRNASHGESWAKMSPQRRDGHSVWSQNSAVNGGYLCAALGDLERSCKAHRADSFTPRW